MNLSDSSVECREKMDKILEEIPVELNKASTVYKRYGMNVLSHSLQYNTIQYNTTLFYYASHTQQKLVSRWGVGKHVTINYLLQL